MIVPGFDLLSHLVFNLVAGVVITVAVVWLFRD